MKETVKCPRCETQFEFTPGASSSLHGEFGLTEREAQIADLIAKGLSGKAAAESLGKTDAYIRSMLIRIFRKVGVNSRVQLTLIALNQPRTWL
jgi:DNA-binding NarL/FixJ family response regulator